MVPRTGHYKYSFASCSLRVRGLQTTQEQGAAVFFDFLRGWGINHMIEIPRQLQVQPKLSFHPKKPFEPDGCIRRKAALPMNHFVHTRIRDSNVPGITVRVQRQCEHTAATTGYELR